MRGRKPERMDRIGSGPAAGAPQTGSPLPNTPRINRSTSHQAGAALADWLAKADRRAIEHAREMTNADISDHAPEHLRVIDDLLDEYLREDLVRRRETDSASVVFGGGFAGGFVRNLAPSWADPGWWQG